MDRIIEKAIHSNFPLDVTNDMIAKASNWEERLQAPKCNKENDLQFWTKSFLHLLTLTKIKTEGSDYLQKTYHCWEKLTNYTCFKQDKKTYQRYNRVLQPLCTLWLPWKTKQTMVPCVSQIMSKTKTFRPNQNLTCANYGIYAATCVICNEQYVGQTKNKFRSDGHRTAATGTDRIAKMKKMKWPCRGTIQCSMVP